MLEKRHFLLHLAQKSLAADALVGRDLLLITQTELLATPVPRPNLRLQ